MFRTIPHLEKNRVVFQLGTANPELAVQAAKVVANDVAAIDVNSGCPKHFSMHSGMGAALLRTPDLLCEILTSLVTQVGRPLGVPISVKIRLLGSEADTCALVRRLVSTGITNLTLHCRTTSMRPREPAIRNDGQLASVAQICHEAGVSCLVNGDVPDRTELAALREKYGVDGAMIARGAEANPSCFAGPAKPWYEIVHEYFDLCKEFDNHVVNTKFCLGRMLPGKSPIYANVVGSRTMEAVEQALKGATKEEDDRLRLKLKGKPIPTASEIKKPSKDPKPSKQVKSNNVEQNDKNLIEQIQPELKSFESNDAKRPSSPTSSSSSPEAKRKHITAMS